MSIYLEPNSYHNVDCMVAMKEMPNEYVDLVITDPPYPTTSRGSSGDSGGMFKKEVNKRGMVFEHNDIKPVEYIPEIYRVLKGGSHCYIMTNHTNLQEILNVSVRSGFGFIKSLIWDKQNKIMGQYYMSQFEYVLFLRKGEAKKINNCGCSDILSIPNIKTKRGDGSNYHDTEKPVTLMEILIENSSNKNDLVLDPFGGFGTTAVACHNVGRRYISFELDEHYYKESKARLEAVQSQMSLFL